MKHYGCPIIACINPLCDMECQMNPKRTDVNIICAKCQKPISGEHRRMTHDVAKGLWLYDVDCHGAQDSGDHLMVKAHEDSHGVILTAFPSEASPVATPASPQLSAQPTASLMPDRKPNV